MPIPQVVQNLTYANKQALSDTANSREPEKQDSVQASTETGTVSLGKLETVGRAVTCRSDEEHDAPASETTEVEDAILDPNASDAKRQRELLLS